MSDKTIVAQLQALKKSRKDIINLTQSNIETNNRLYQEKAVKIEQLLGSFTRNGQQSDRNIIQPTRPLPLPSKTSLHQPEKPYTIDIQHRVKIMGPRQQKVRSK